MALELQKSMDEGEVDEEEEKEYSAVESKALDPDR